MNNIAIYITDNLIRFGRSIIDSNKQLSIKEDEINITSLKDEEVPLSFKKFLHENKIAPEYLTLAIPRTQVSVRYLTLPTVNDSEIKQMVDYDLNNLFPFKAEELIFDHAVISKSPDGYSQVMLVAVQREIIQKYIDLFKKVGLSPDAIDLSTVSLFNQFCAQKKEAGNYLLINVDDGFMELIFITDQKLSFSRGINFRVPPKKQDLIKEVNLTITVLRDRDFQADKIILSGKSIDLVDFSKGLEESLGYKVEIDNRLEVVKGLLGKKSDNTLSVNLLPEELKIRKIRDKRRKSLVYFATLILLNLSLIANISFLKMKAKDEYLFLLKSEIKKIETQASALQRKMLKVQILQNSLNSGRSMLGLLSELYRVAPEGVYLISLDIAGRKPQGVIVLIGQAKDSETVLKFANGLKRSGFINKADVSYITKRKITAQELVDFEVRASF